MLFQMHSKDRQYMKGKFLAIFIAETITQRKKPWSRL